MLALVFLGVGKHAMALFNAILWLLDDVKDILAELILRADAAVSHTVVIQADGIIRSIVRLECTPMDTVGPIAFTTLHVMDCAFAFTVCGESAALIHVEMYSAKPQSKHYFIKVWHCFVYIGIGLLIVGRKLQTSSPLLGARPSKANAWEEGNTIHLYACAAPYLDLAVLSGEDPEEDHDVAFSLTRFVSHSPLLLYLPAASNCNA
eukprot:scaffold238202_cov15-Prasinocladus_malaysianus.AAC.1